MEDIKRTEAMCCFCGISGYRNEMVSIIVSMDNSNEQQNMFSHPKCFIDRLHPQIMLHPDIIEAADS